MMLPRTDKQHFTRHRNYSRTFVPKIRHVPVKARQRWSKFITEIVAKRQANPTDFKNWKILLASSKCILHTASREGGKHKFHNEKLIIERIVPCILKKKSRFYYRLLMRCAWDINSQRELSVTCYLPSPKVLQPVQA